MNRTSRILANAGGVLVVGLGAFVATATDASAVSRTVYVYRDGNGNGCRATLTSSVSNFAGRTYSARCTNPTRYSVNNSISSINNQSDCYAYFYPGANYSGGYDNVVDPHTIDVVLPNGHNDQYSSMSLAC